MHYQRIFPSFLGMSKSSFEKLVEIMATLRGPGGCPWDREQTFQSITPHTLEETHEVIEAIEKKNYASLREELGDLLLQVVFYAQMASEEKLFTIDDVAEAISQKLIHRHPHVFGDLKVSGSKEVLENWEQLKKKETGKKRLLDGLPRGMPALLRAYRMGEKTSRVGFDWPDVGGVLDKIHEETQELVEAQASKNQQHIEDEYGDVLLAVANLGRFLKVDPEGALRRASDRYQQRFEWMESKLTEQKREDHKLSLEEWDELWNQAKQDLAR